MECEVLIVGAGITGLTLARELLARGVDNIMIVEKESGAGRHASGRNSGVLHAGVYYSPGTLKARFCVEGNRLMKEYCRSKGLRLLECGKVIVARNYPESILIEELKKRADSSGAEAKIIDSKELKEIEPYAQTFDKALLSPNTAVIDPKEIVESLRQDLESSRKVRIAFGTRFEGLRQTSTAVTSSGNIKFRLFINAGGAYADRVAHSFGVGLNYKIIPFKGLYKRLVKDRTWLVAGNIYPVPDLRYPFLGVHFTKGVDGDVYVGPTAIPALGRENYSLAEDLTIESLSILFRDGVLMLTDPSFRVSAIREIERYVPRVFYEEARTLVPCLKPEDLEPTDKVGIRAQLVDWGIKRLVMDFLVIRDGDSLHILNAVSPAFTCSMAFATYAASLLLD